MKASEWWTERLAYFIGEAHFHPEPADQWLFRRYAAIAVVQMEINAAIEAVEERPRRAA